MVCHSKFATDAPHLISCHKDKKVEQHSGLVNGGPLMVFMRTKPMAKIRYNRIRTENVPKVAQSGRHVAERSLDCIVHALGTSDAGPVAPLSGSDGKQAL